MEEPKDRLKQARVAKGFESPSEAARVTKLNKNTWISHENGNRPLSLKAALRYGEALGVLPAWLIYGEEKDGAEIDETMDRLFLQMGLDGTRPPEPDDQDFEDVVRGYPVIQVPLVSWVSAGALKNRDGVTPADIDRYVPIADLPRGDWIALKVEGDSMNRIAPDGSVIILNRADDALINDRYYVFALGSGETTFKRFRRAPQLMLQPFSTNLDHMSMPIDEGDLYVIGRVRRVITDV